MAAGTAYSKRYGGGFVDGSGGGTPIDSTFLNAVEAALLQLLGVAPTADGQVMQWDNANTRLGPALLLNKNVDPAAAIAKSKLDLTGANGIVNADVAGAAAIAYSKLNLTSSIANGDVATAAAIAGSKLNCIPATTLNASPTNGEVGLLTDSTSAPTYVWAFVWNASAAKWMFTGGSPGFVSVDTSESTTSASYVALTTAGPSFTVPRAGDYIVTIGSQQLYGGGGGPSYHSYDVGGTGAVDLDAGTNQASGSSGTNGSRPASVMMRKKTGLAASTALVSKYKSDGTKSATFSSRFISVIPVSVT